MNIPAIIANQISLPISFQIIIFSFIALMMGIVLGILTAHFLARYFPNLLEPHKDIKTDPTVPVVEADKDKKTRHVSSAEIPEEMIKDTIYTALQLYTANIEERLESFEARINLAKIPQETALELRRDLDKIIDQLSGVSTVLGEIPIKVRNEMARYKRQEEERKMIEEQRIKEEELQKKTAHLNSKKQDLREGFIKRLEELEKRDDLIEISNLTRKIIDQLRQASSDPSQLEKDFLPYLRMIPQVETLRQKLESFDGSSFLALEEKEKEIEEEFEFLETSHKNLSKYHSVAWFFDLLAAASQHASLRSETDELKRSLGLEDVLITPGTEPEPQDMDKIEVETTEGYGPKTIISEVLENGYKLRGSGTILKKPRVKVRLEG